jgi:hypothetical protein
MSDLCDLFSYLLPYPAVLQICDSKLQPFTNLPSKLIITVLLVDSGKSSLVIEQKEYQFNPTFSWMSPRLSYGSTATVISTDIEKRNQNLLPIHFYWNWIEKSVQLTASSWRQNSKSSLLYICISTRIFQLMWNICDCFFSLCSLSYYSSSACQEVLQSRVWAISSSFYSGHKSSKASIRPKSFNYPISYPTTNPTHPPWLITKSSRFIRSTLCPIDV